MHVLLTSLLVGTILYLFCVFFLMWILSQEYNAEGIDWTKVDFEDNQECLDLIEKV